MQNKIAVESEKYRELNELAAIAINAFNSIILLDHDGQLLWANKGFETLYGYTFEEYKLHNQSKNSGFIRILKETDKNFFVQNPSLSFTHSFLNKHALRKWVQTTLTPIFNEKKELERFIGIEIDITQQKEVEEELIQKQENTQTLSEHLESVKDYVEDQISLLSTQKKALEIAKERSEQVLNKVIPYEVAIQLKRKGFAAPRHYKKVTLLNLNIRNFFKLTEDIEIEELVMQLHNCFVQFDNVLESHFVEKIKTTGGIYLGAGGVPLRNRSNPIDVVLASLQIREDIKIINEKREQLNLPIFDTGIGIHTGKVVAGVVGKNKLSYDIWGDTVSHASITENQAPLNEILISEHTYEEIKVYFDCSIHPTENSTFKTYLVLRIKPEFAFDSEGIKPAKNFMQLLSKL